MRHASGQTDRDKRTNRQTDTLITVLLSPIEVVLKFIVGENLEKRLGWAPKADELIGLYGL